MKEKPGSVGLVSKKRRTWSYTCGATGAQGDKKMQGSVGGPFLTSPERLGKPLKISNLDAKACGNHHRATVTARNITKSGKNGIQLSTYKREELGG